MVSIPLVHADTLSSQLNAAIQQLSLTQPGTVAYAQLETLIATLKWLGDPLWNPSPLSTILPATTVVLFPNKVTVHDRVTPSPWGLATDRRFVNRERVQGTVIRISGKYNQPIVKWDDRRSPIMHSHRTLLKIGKRL